MLTVVRKELRCEIYTKPGLHVNCFGKTKISETSNYFSFCNPPMKDTRSYLLTLQTNDDDDDDDGDKGNGKDNETGEEEFLFYASLMGLHEENLTLADTKRNCWIK